MAGNPSIELIGDQVTVVVRGITRPSPSIVDGLREAGTSTVHEAAGRTGLLDCDIRPIQAGVTMAGSAVTISCGPGDNLMVHAAVEVCRPGDVLVVTTPEPNYGLIGELLATSLRAHGVVGLVIDAGVRDVAVLREMGFPVWSRTISARGTAKAMAGSVNTPIVCAGQVINPGDVIVADDDGVVCVPRESSPDVLFASRQRTAAETQKRVELEAGALGVDMYRLRPLLARLGVRYVGESTGDDPAGHDPAAGSAEGGAIASGGGIRCLMMRGGTSRGLFLLADELPADPAERDDVLIRLMGSPHVQQVDGLGGGHPLTSKVAVISRSTDGASDVDYLFLQVSVDAARVSDRQPCGNILAAVAPFAIERGLVSPQIDTTSVRIRMVNTGAVVVARVRTPGGRVAYDGDTYISGVAAPAAPILLEFTGIAGSVCGSLLPTGNVRDEIDGVPVTCVDNGMPVVLIPAASLGVTGHESVAELEGNQELRAALERIRLRAGQMMRLGDVRETTIPKLTLVAEPANGGSLSTRTFIPHRCHTSIGVLGAVSVATGATLPGSVASGLLRRVDGDTVVRLEHPSGYLDTTIESTQGGSPDGAGAPTPRTAIVRTARKLIDGIAWPAPAVPRDAALPPAELQHSASG